MGAGSVVQVLLADRVDRRQRLDAGEVGLGRFETCNLLGTLPLGFVNGGLESARVDFEQRLPLFHQIAFAVVLLDQVTGHLRADDRIDVAVERADPFHVNRHIALRDGNDLDRRRCRRGHRFFAAGSQSKAENQGRGNQGWLHVILGGRLYGEQEY